MTSGLVLWDVDGTLVRTAGAGTLAFLDAVEAVVGLRPDDGAGAFMAGKTDPQIALELLAGLGVASPDEHLAGVLVALERALGDLVQHITDQGYVLPGVPEVVSTLAASGAWIQTLLTGNLVANAKVKLAALGLGPGIDYDLGAYGSDHADRCALVPIALGRLNERGIEVDRDRVWVIGDTPRDLECARAGAVRCLLVGTGSYSVSELSGLGADAVLADLSDPAHVIGLLSGR